MRFLSFSLFLLLLGCASYPKKLGYRETTFKTQKIVNPYFSDITKDYVYKANISVFKNKFGGILVLKKIDDYAHRVAFTTELGNTIFDFTITETNFKANRILKEMDRNILLNVLERDFRALIKEESTAFDIFKKENKVLAKTKIASKWHYYLIENDTLNNIIRTGNQKEKVQIEFSEIKNNVARHIQITHKNNKLAISLQAIK